MSNAGRRLKGRQMLKLVYECQKRDEAQNAVFGIENILAAQMVGDKLQQFLNDSESIFAGQGAPAASQKSSVAGRDCPR